MIHFDFEFYQQKNQGGTLIADHEALFLDQIRLKGFSLITNPTSYKGVGLDIDELDFIIYALFKHQHSLRAIYTDYKSISKIAYTRIEEFDNFYEFSTTVRNQLTQLQRGADNSFSEYQGVAGSLIFNNLIFGLTNADYTSLPISGTKDLDFTINVASTGTKLVIVESKGMFGMSKSISTKANHIMLKKADQDYLSNTRDLFYGIIVQIPYYNEKVNAKLTLVDPEIFDLTKLNPLLLKIHTRLNYYINKLALLVYSDFHDKLEQLLKTIEGENQNWQEIYNSKKSELDLEYSFRPFNFKCTRIEYNGEIIIGKLFKIDDNLYSYYGIYESVLKKLENPLIEVINSLRVDSRKNIYMENVTVKIEEKTKNSYKMNKIKVNGKINIYETGEVIGSFRNFINNNNQHKMESKFYQNLTKEEKQVLDKYKANTDEYAYKLNASLCSHKAEAFKEDIELLDGVINKYTSDKSRVLYRATTVNYIDPFINDNKYSNPGYMSTTLNKDSLRTLFRSIEDGQIPAYVEIECKPGTHMAPMESNEAFGGMESEMLLGRENNFILKEAKLERSRQVIENIMGKLYGEKYQEIKIYAFELIAENK